MRSKPLGVNLDRCHELFKLKTPNSSNLNVQSGLIWRTTPRGPIRTSPWAGSVSTRSNGYKCWVVGIDSKLYLVSRIIYFMAHGKDPYPYEIDHIDRNPLNNAVINLREVNKTIQNINTKVRSDSNSGIKGVSWDKTRCKWAPYITVEGKKMFLGRYDCLYSASIARNKAVLRYYPSEVHEISLIDLSTVEKISRDDLKT